ncbi:MAG: sigma-70 family RNA polymerase sigma factor [Patescibacteria group bacterium]
MDNHTLDTDEELVRLSLRDKQLFGVLVARYEHKLSSYIYRLGKLGQEDIEDLLQEIFLKVYQNLNGFDQSLKFSSWIYRIAHNETMVFFRRRRIRPHGHLIPDSEEVLAQMASEFNLARDTEVHHDAELLAAALEKLPEEYREILVLQFFEHKSYDEISDILALPPGTVSTRIRRAKKRIADDLRAHGYVYG